MNTARVWMRNLGTTVIYYEWIRVPFKLCNVEGKDDKEKHISEKIQVSSDTYIYIARLEKLHFS